MDTPRLSLMRRTQVGNSWHRQPPPVPAVPVVALKQSGADFGYHRELAALGREKGFVLITGADTRIAEAFALGAGGVVSGL